MTQNKKGIIIETLSTQKISFAAFECNLDNIILRVNCTKIMFQVKPRINDTDERTSITKKITDTTATTTTEATTTKTIETTTIRNYETKTIFEGLIFFQIEANHSWFRQTYLHNQLFHCTFFLYQHIGLF